MNPSAKMRMGASLIAHSVLAWYYVSLNEWQNAATSMFLGAIFIGAYIVFDAWAEKVRQKHQQERWT